MVYLVIFYLCLDTNIYVDASIYTFYLSIHIWLQESLPTLSDTYLDGAKQDHDKGTKQKLQILNLKICVEFYFKNK